MPNGLTITVNIDTHDIRALAERLDVVPAFKDGIQAAAIWIKGDISQYPKATEANVEGPYPKRWYKRGTGPHWALKGGGFHFRKTSETLSKRWTVVSINDGLGAIIGNNASYGPYVQSRERQTDFHKRNGWKTAEDEVEQNTGKALEIIEMFIQEAIKRK